MLNAKKALVSVPAKYSDFANVFSKEATVVLSEHIKINTHTIDLKEGKYPPYRLIYSLSLVELETLKSYIEINLANSFIYSSKTPADTLILFD